MKENRRPVFNTLFILVGVFVFSFFVVLLTLSAVILHRLRDSDVGTSGQSSDSQSLKSLRQEINALKLLLASGNIENMDRQLVDLQQEFTNNREENTQDEQLGIKARQRREKSDHNKIDRTASFEHTPYFRGSTLYTRWGRVNCSETPSTTTVYSGIIGNSHLGHQGGGSNHQCLPFGPEYGYQQKGLQYSVGAGGSLIQGVEYRAENIYPFKNENNGDQTLNKEDAVCSVCYVSTRSVTLMIPGKRSCPEEWTLEYVGYLMAAHFKNHRTDFICVDESPEGKPSGENTNGGSHLYPVEGGCGALPCPNYREGLEIACVVCTK
ncbi:uncharacterized protein LOC111629766 [Centruroides sculpturatus]|uniref:uncharacterized protein LOC111629766 n=1 Tax=Centruroides sculpturatus TaxID=218467 RepID=UPI000C6C89F8|nr:uncharacterized protein LOC111629766 [Centruroides sculpturatus]